MAGNKTLTIIKPLAVKHGDIGSILAKINEAGFRIIAIKYTHLRLEEAKTFYAVHKGKSFYETLVSFMSSGPIVLAILEKENAVEDYRNLIGSTDPSVAAKGTIRNIFGTNIQANAVHGSDSDENAEIECNFFFSQCERFS
jgi:nucleoside-diphosphate kinase